MSTMNVRTTYLEQTDPGELRPARPPLDVDVVRAEVPSPELSRYLYTSVGGNWYWIDRLGWSIDRWRTHLERPGVETWLAWCRGTPAGYVELEAQSGDAVEIAYFGVLPSFTGRGIGGYLLTVGTARAWDLATRWPDREPTSRVWLHTCTLDGPHALGNYRARGFRVYDVTEQEEEVPQTPPGPWPGARPGT
ncbi:MAG: GNAT family N-acetyltransferase [Propionibacteriales bacterium]|nr:GNAT family N-acetyltransferase [Propionibacteriales bacterium]